ncbi:MAG: DNA-binding protein [Flavobacteriaceae bacterium]|nr:DNA-binding protein [Flavobacteriaceae bacterium]|tara:strand:+ start:8651 stop:9046 length:396 start_codon:yes stop_codon:yes gene_type:complete
MKMEREEIFSKVLRAGRRTYFFDVRSTKAGDYYLTLTESKKFTNEDGSFHYKKHKIYLYKEDFREFSNILNEMTDYVISEKGEEVISERHQKDFKKEDSSESTKETNDENEKEEGSNESSNEFTDVSFDDI